MNVKSDPNFSVEFQKIVHQKISQLKGAETGLGGGSSGELIYNLIEHLKASTVVETGVASGYSSLAALMSLKNRNGHLYSSDRPYVLKNNDRFVGMMVPEELKKFWTLYRMPDRDGLPRILKRAKKIDLVHYDSDKSREGRLWAYPLLWEKLSPGGIFITDDIVDNFGFRDFCLSIDKDPFVVPHGKNYFGIIQK